MSDLPRPEYSTHRRHDHEEACECVHCRSCREGSCLWRCAAKWREECEWRSRKAAARAHGLVQEYKRTPLPPDQVEWLVAEGYEKCLERIDRERNAAKNARDKRRDR